MNSDHLGLYVQLHDGREAFYDGSWWIDGYYVTIVAYDFELWWYAATRPITHGLPYPANYVGEYSDRFCFKA